MSQKLRFGTTERINYRSDRHVITRRTWLSYDRLMQLDTQRAYDDYARKNEFEKFNKRGAR